MEWKDETGRNTIITAMRQMVSRSSAIQLRNLLAYAVKELFHAKMPINHHGFNNNNNNNFISQPYKRPSTPKT